MADRDLYRRRSEDLRDSRELECQKPWFMDLPPSFKYGDIFRYKVYRSSLLTGGFIFKDRFAVVRGYDSKLGLVAKRYLDPLDWISIWLKFKFRDWMLGFDFWFYRRSRFLRKGKT